LSHSASPNNYSFLLSCSLLLEYKCLCLSCHCILEEDNLFWFYRLMAAWSLPWVWDETLLLN
jgi:hypothetical protein